MLQELLGCHPERSVGIQDYTIFHISKKRVYLKLFKGLTLLFLGRFMKKLAIIFLATLALINNSHASQARVALAALKKSPQGSVMMSFMPLYGFAGGEDVLAVIAQAAKERYDERRE